MDKKKLRYAILREIDKGNRTITEKDLEVKEAEFDDAIRFLTSNGYLNGIDYGDNRPIMDDGTAGLTEKGEEFLEENSGWKKAYNAAKEIKEWIWK